MEEQAKLLADLTAAISSMNAKLNDIHPALLELRSRKPEIERSTEGLRAEVGGLRSEVGDLRSRVIKVTRSPTPSAKGVNLAPLLPLSADAPTTWPPALKPAALQACVDVCTYVPLLDTNGCVVEVPAATCPSPDQDAFSPPVRVTTVELLREQPPELVPMSASLKSSSSYGIIVKEALEVDPSASIGFINTMPSTCSTDCLPQQPIAVSVQVASLPSTIDTYAGSSRGYGSVPRSVDDDDARGATPASKLGVSRQLTTPLPDIHFSTWTLLAMGSACVDANEGLTPPSLDIVNCNCAEMNNIHWPSLKSGTNLLSPSDTGSLDAVELDCMGWLQAIQVKIVGSGVVQLPWPPPQICTCWSYRDIFIVIQIELKPCPDELPDEWNRVLHYWPSHPEMDRYLPLDESQEKLGRAATFDLQMTGYCVANNSGILVKLGCVAAHSAKETIELLQIFVFGHSVRKALPSSGKLIILRPTTSVWKLLQGDSGIILGTQICIQESLDEYNPTSVIIETVKGYNSVVQSRFQSYTTSDALHNGSTDVQLQIAWFSTGHTTVMQPQNISPELGGSILCGASELALDTFVHLRLAGDQCSEAVQHDFTQPCCREGEHSGAAVIETWCLCLHQLLLARSVKWAAPSSVFNSMNCCQPRCQETILAYPYMGPYCSGFSSASACTFCEGKKLEFKKGVPYVMDQYTDMSYDEIEIGHIWSAKMQVNAATLPLVVCTRLNTLSCTLFSTPWDPGGTLVQRVISASRPCVSPYLARRTIDKTASSKGIVLGNELYAPWDPGGHRPRSINNGGLRASRMLRRGECHEPCGLLHEAAWAAAGSGIEAQG